MEENEDVELVALADVEVDYIHDSVCLLEEVEGLVVLFFLDEGNGVVVEFCQHDGDFVLGDAQLLVVVLVKSVVLVEGPTPVRLVAR